MSAESEVRSASEQFYSALNRMAKGETGAMNAVWSHCTGATALHPIGGRDVGWAQIGTSFDNVAGIASGGEIRLKDQLHPGDRRHGLRGRYRSRDAHARWAQGVHRAPRDEHLSSRARWLESRAPPYRCIARDDGCAGPHSGQGVGHTLWADVRGSSIAAPHEPAVGGAAAGSTLLTVVPVSEGR